MAESNSSQNSLNTNKTIFPNLSPILDFQTALDRSETDGIFSSTRIETARRVIPISQREKLALTKDKYWRLRTWIQALEKVCLTDTPRPGLSPPLIRKLQELLADLSLRKFSDEGSGCLSSQPPNLLSRASLNLSNEEGKMLDKWFGIEIQSHAEQVVEIYRSRLKGSALVEDQELLDQVNQAEVPLSIVEEKLRAQEEEVKELDLEMEAETEARDSCLTSYNNNLAQLKEEMDRFQEETLGQVRPPIVAEYLKLLKHQDEFLRTKLELAKMRQTMEENPSEVIAEFEEAYNLLFKAGEKLEAKIKTLEALRSKYEALGPEFQKLVAEWRIIEDKIDDKEWVLNQLENQSTSFNNSLSSP